MQVFDAHNDHDGTSWHWLKNTTGFTLWLEGIGSLCGPADLQVMTAWSLRALLFTVPVIVCMPTPRIWTSSSSQDSQKFSIEAHAPHTVAVAPTHACFVWTAFT